MNKRLTQEQLNVLKILSRNNNLVLQQLIKGTAEHTDRIVSLYQKTRPILEDLNNHGININSLADLKYPDFDEDAYKNSIPILVKWLKNNSILCRVKVLIIDVLIEKPFSKEYAFDVILDMYKTMDTSCRDEWGYKTGLSTVLGNAMLRWADDAHAEFIFNLLKNYKFRKDTFLLSSVSNFKKIENIRRATKMLCQELEMPNLSNARLFTIISTLKKLNAVSAKDIIYPFINFPENYKRSKYFDPKIYGYTTDTEVRNEANKTIEKFNKPQRKILQKR